MIGLRNFGFQRDSKIDQFCLFYVGISVFLWHEGSPNTFKHCWRASSNKTPVTHQHIYTWYKFILLSFYKRPRCISCGYGGLYCILPVQSIIRWASLGRTDSCSGRFRIGGGTNTNKLCEISYIFQLFQTDYVIWNVTEGWRQQQKEKISKK